MTAEQLSLLNYGSFDSDSYVVKRHPEHEDVKIDYPHGMSVR